MFQILRALIVIFFVFRMLAAVKFNHQIKASTTEIHDKRSNRELPIKFKSMEGFTAQQPPQFFFRQGLPAAKPQDQHSLRGIIHKTCPRPSGRGWRAAAATTGEGKRTLL